MAASGVKPYACHHSTVLDSPPPCGDAGRMVHPREFGHALRNRSETRSPGSAAPVLACSRSLGGRGTGEGRRALRRAMPALPAVDAFTGATRLAPPPSLPGLPRPRRPATVRGPARPGEDARRNAPRHAGPQAGVRGLPGGPVDRVARSRARALRLAPVRPRHALAPHQSLPVDRPEPLRPRAVPRRGVPGPRPEAGDRRSEVGKNHVATSIF